MRIELDSVALASRAHAFAAHHVREMMRHSKVMLSSEDRDALHRLTSDAFAMGFVAAIEAMESKRMVRDGAEVVRVLQRRPKRREVGIVLRKPGGGT